MTPSSFGQLSRTSSTASMRAFEAVVGGWILSPEPHTLNSGSERSLSREHQDLAGMTPVEQLSRTSSTASLRDRTSVSPMSRSVLLLLH